MNYDGPRLFGALKFGLLLLGSGLGFLLAYIISFNIQHNAIASGGAIMPHTEQLYFSLIAMWGGLGLIICYLIERKERNSIKDKEVVRKPMEWIED